MPGPDREAKAAALQQALSRVFTDPAEAWVTRPMKTAEMRVQGLDDATTEEEIAAAIAQAGDCEALLVKVGPIRPAMNGLGAAP